MSDIQPRYGIFNVTDHPGSKPIVRFYSKRAAEDKADEYGGRYVVRSLKRRAKKSKLR
jgi:hypothetical protein